MVLDLFWVSGEVFSSAAVLFGACLVLAESEPLLRLLGKKSAAALTPSVNDLRLVEELARNGADGRSNCGNAVIDTQHQGLFDAADNLRAGILAGRPVDEVSATVDVLIRQVVAHFHDEEAILAASGYPETAKHAALHRELVVRAATLRGRFRVGALRIGELFQFLAHDVISEHMLSADRDFTPYLESRR